MIDKRFIVVFDLDDTLYEELDFLKSGFLKISKYIDARNFNRIYKEMLSWYQEGKNVFNILSAKYSVDHELLLNLYRNHIPEIRLRRDAKEILEKLNDQGIIMGLITDGRTLTQNNKIDALGINGYFDIIVISEEFGSKKPDLNNFKIFEIKFPNSKYIYIGDNTDKDFIAPSKLGWNTYCLSDRGNNIHKQDLLFLPKSTILIQMLSDILIE